MSRLICFRNLEDLLQEMENQLSHTTPEWSIFVTVVKQTVDLDKESYHKLFDILKQYQKEVNGICAEKIARNANPLALVSAAQQYPDTYYQTSKPHKSYAPPSKQSSSTRSHATTRHKGKEIAKPITPPSESYSEEDSDPKQAQRDKDMQKNLALIPKYMNENQTGQFGNQMTVTVAGAREIIGSQECRKPKRAKDYTYYKEKTLLCKQAEKGIPLQADQSDWLEDTDEEIDEQELEAHYSFMAKIQEVLPADLGSDAEPLEKVDSNVIPDSSGMCDNDNRADQNTKECDDERAMLANLITNLKLDTEENKKIQKKLKKANTSLAHELKDCKSILEEANRTLGESNRTRDRYLGALHDKEVELAKYKTCKDHTIENDILEIVKEKNNELVKQSLLTKSSYEGLVKEKNKVIKDLKLKEEKNLDKLIAVEKQLNFLNEIVYKQNQSIQTIHMLAPKSSTYKGRTSFANPKYLKKAQYEKPCLYEISYDKYDLANIFAPHREETLTLEQESRSKLNKDTIKPYDYTKQNSFYEIFKPPSREYLDQLAHANEIRKKMWRKTFVKYKPNIFKNTGFLPTQKSISKSRQAYNVMTNNINHFKEIVDLAWEKHTYDKFRAPTTEDTTVLLKICLIPLALKTQNDSFIFANELKHEMFADLQYVQSIEKEICELKSNKADFSHIYDLLLQDCVSNDVMCSYLYSLSDLDAHTELQCLYLYKVKECECLAEKLSKQTKNVSKEVYNELLRCFAKLEKHLISLELALQQCQEQITNDTVCKEKASTVFLKEREQYFEIQDLKTQLQDKNIAMS
ncbi:hypothetical protein Tco_1071789 [Tanacetum coccineum]